MGPDFSHVTSRLFSDGSCGIRFMAPDGTTQLMIEYIYIYIDIKKYVCLSIYLSVCLSITANKQINK